MDQCIDEGTLRAHIDGVLPPATANDVRAHLTGCPACTRRLAELRGNAELAAALLAAPAPDTDAALARVRAAKTKRQYERGNIPMHINRTRRRGLGALAAIVMAVALLALPPVQAAADQLLKIFRVQSVVFVPVDSDRLRELEQLDFDGQTLFVGEPKVVTDPGEPQLVASAAEASAAVGFPVTDPALPVAPTSAEYRVQGASTMEFQVNVEAAQQLLTLAGVQDVTLPKELGDGPITADVPPAVVTTYRGADYELTLMQGTSPEVTVPAGVELKQLGTAMLRLLGSSPDQAEKLASQIDWSTTFVFPFPANMSGVRTVNVDGLTALMVTARERGEPSSQIYWQRGERFYVLHASGNVDEATLLGVVSSL
jgi:hypothetical protein